MVEFRTDKEVLQIMGNCVDFVCELIDYIAEYPDDDYMTMECLCRKLHKHELIAKVDGHWQPLDKRCEDCIFVEGSHWCDGCDKTPKGMKEYDEYFAKAKHKESE